MSRIISTFADGVIRLSRIGSLAARFVPALVILMPATVLAQGKFPEVLDPRLKLSLIAEDPQIVTPIGLAIDAQDRLFVLESHTHERPSDYTGPQFDRVKRFVDRDGDGRFEDISVFADGIQQGLNLAFSPAGVLYVVCAREVVELPDENQDGVCDGSRAVLKMQTRERYSHNCLLGITFDRDGMLLIGRGNSGSQAYEFVGSDGSRVSGYGDGGSIIRCRPDGSLLEEFATGFWNPFEIKYDHAGRLLCVDNDPDARGPNRLVDVVRGGDYGYKSLYGGGGNHPFQGWDGSLPGTLPYISGTGEAPCDLIDCHQSSLPKEFAGSILVTVWNENSIERHITQPRGTSLTAESEILVAGDDEFRPVAIEADSRGNLYFTDWVSVAYPNHGRGRIWRLSNSDSSDRLTPRGYFETPVEHEAAVARLESDDPFAFHRAVIQLAEQSSSQELLQMADNMSPQVRLGCLLAAQRSPLDPAVHETLARKFLADPDPNIRRAALVWVGTSLMTQIGSSIDSAIAGDNVSPLLFETYLATVECLEPEFARAVSQQSEARAKSIPRHLPQSLLAELISDDQRTAEVRGLAIDHLEDRQRFEKLLMDSIDNPHQQIRLAAIRKLSGYAASKTRNRLVRLASEQTAMTAERCEALLALSHDPQLDPTQILPLLDATDYQVAVEAARTLRIFQGHAAVRDAAIKKLQEIREQASDTGLIEQLRFLCNQPQLGRPDSAEAWQQSLASGGDPTVGSRVFRAAHATCSSCHTIGKSGGMLGPDLSNIGQSVDRRQIIHSILRPSDQFPPQYQAWIVLTVDGQTFTGLQLDHKAGGAIEMFTTAGKTEHFGADDIEAYRASRQSVMPNGLEQNLTLSEFRDLVAYLESLR